MSLSQVGINSAMDLFANYAGQGSQMGHGLPMHRSTPTGISACSFSPALA